MELITITEDNLANEHICCAIAKEDDCQVSAKKAWLRDRLADGLIFKKGNVRGKCFIEYIPAEKAWAPVDAPNYMYIDCLWVSGRFKGQGSSTLLLDECIRDSVEKGCAGLVALSSAKKLPFLSDPGFLRHKGFRLADEAPPYFELMYLPFGEDAAVPRFAESARTPLTGRTGWTLFYSHQCPFTAKYVPLLAEAAEERGAEFEAIRFMSAQQAQSAPSAFTAFSLFYNGEFITHEIQSVGKFAALLEKHVQLK